MPVLLLASAVQLQEVVRTLTRSSLRDLRTLLLHPRPFRRLLLRTFLPRPGGLEGTIAPLSIGFLGSIRRSTGRGSRL